MSSIASRLPIDVVKHILSYDNYIIEGNKVVKLINKIKKNDERYGILYKTFYKNMNCAVVDEYNLKLVFLGANGNMIYLITYINNRYCVTLVKVGQYDNSYNNLSENILYERK